MANELFTLWVKSDCPFCVDAQHTLLERQLTHTVNVMDDELERLDEVKKLWNHTTVPLITVQKEGIEVFIGGYTDLIEWFKIQDNNKLEND